MEITKWLVDLLSRMKEFAIIDDYSMEESLTGISYEITITGLNQNEIKYLWPIEEEDI